MNNLLLSRIFGIVFLVIAAYICVSSFWAIGNKVRDSIVLTSYVTNIAPNQEIKFGYGGEQPTEKADVLFQSPETSNVSFSVKREGDDKYVLTGIDDQILVHGERFKPQQSIAIENGDTFAVRGPLSRIAFRFEADNTSNRLVLHLTDPLYRDLYSDQTRVVIGPSNEPVPALIDEILIRALPTTKSYRLRIEDNSLYMLEEEDLANQTSQNSLSKLAGTAQPIKLEPGQEHTFGTINLAFHHYGTSFLGTQSNPKFFGIKLVIAAILVGLAFFIGPHAPWRFGFTVFGCTSLFVSVGLVLSARETFFYPHRAGFDEYLFFLYLSVLLLCVLRIPFNPDESGSKKSDYYRLLALYPLFLIIYFLIRENLPPKYASWSVIGAIFFIFLVFIVAVLFSMITHYGGRFLLARLSKLAWTPNRRWFWIIVPTIIIISFVIYTALTGHKEALWIGGKRIHLPTLFLPIIVIWMSLAGRVAEKDKNNTRIWLFLYTFFALVAISIYRFASGDNGGAIVLAFGMMTALLLSTRIKSVPIAAFLILVLGGWLLAKIETPVRFELAWGGDEAGIVYYDQAKNLRMARDMARAGSTWGQGLDLPIPSEVRANIHNDLVAAYVIGFFGWAIFAFVLLGYCLFYNYLFGGVYSSFFSRQIGEENEIANHESQTARSIVLAAVGALTLTFAFQTLWVITASLQKAVPLTGLDLQPISASAISILSFFVILLGFVAVSLAFNHTLSNDETDE